MSTGLSVDVPNYTELSGTFGSTLRDQAIVLQALSIMGERVKATPLMKVISAQLSREKWLSTQQTAYCLVAIAKYAGEGGVSSELNFTYRQNGGKWQDVKTDKSVWQFEMEDVKKGKVEFKKVPGIDDVRPNNKTPKKVGTSKAPKVGKFSTDAAPTRFVIL